VHNARVSWPVKVSASSSMAGVRIGQQPLRRKFVRLAARRNLFLAMTEDGSNAVIEGAKSAFDGIDILVNNVGNPTQESHGSWFDAPFQEWIDDYHQNTIAAVRLVHAFTPAMKERGWGRLIQVSSRNAISPHAHLPTYGAEGRAQQRDPQPV
jgi:NAD(P)-dependent dehydrogenase (short-subunit alcohol dehydrogenase family)